MDAVDSVPLGHGLDQLGRAPGPAQHSISIRMMAVIGAFQHGFGLFFPDTAAAEWKGEFLTTTDGQHGMKRPPPPRPHGGQLAGLDQTTAQIVEQSRPCPLDDPTHIPTVRSQCNRLEARSGVYSAWSCTIPPRCGRVQHNTWRP